MLFFDGRTPFHPMLSGQAAAEKLAKWGVELVIATLMQSLPRAKMDKLVVGEDIRLEVFAAVDASAAWIIVIRPLGD